MLDLVCSIPYQIYLNYYQKIGPFYSEKQEEYCEKNVNDELHDKPQLLIIYHRLPFERKIKNGTEIRSTPKSPNGILPSLLGIFEDGRSGVWIGEEEELIDKNNNRENCAKTEYIDEKKYPNLTASIIFLPKKDIDLFYRVFSKEAFWPTLFSFVERTKFNHQHWDHYVKINRLFAIRIAEIAEPGAYVWIHEYNLWMVPAFLRRMRKDVKIGFFHHTAFPAADIFNIIPWRSKIVESLLQCDFIGFHIPRYVENFVEVLKSHAPVKAIKKTDVPKQFLTHGCALAVDKMTTEISIGDRVIRLSAQPVGINRRNIKWIYEQEKTQQQVVSLQRSMQTKQNGNHKSKQIILSVERLDYVKGPLEKIVAFGEFLEEYPIFRGNVELVYICTPPSEGMRVYEETQRELNQAIEKINEKFANMEWAPVHFIFRAVPFEEVVAYYAIADVAWITPLRDGLNLVAKEYVAVQGLQENPNGVLVISEFAGASVALPYALLTNPYDIKNMKEILLQALTMNKNERKLRMQHLSKTVSFYDVEHWSKSFLRELSMTRSPILEKNESKMITSSKKLSYTSCLLKK